MIKLYIKAHGEPDRFSLSLDGSNRYWLLAKIILSVDRIPPSLCFGTLLMVYTMQVEINNKITEILSNEVPTIEALLDELQITDRQGLAVAVNQEVIRQSAWTEFRIQSHDQITLIQATQGG